MKWLSKNKKWLRIILHIFVISILILQVISKLRFLYSYNIINNEITEMILRVFAFFVIYALKSVIMIIPAPVLYVAAGVVFPTGWAILITYLCLTLEFFLGYLYGKKLGTTKVMALLTKNKKIAGFLEIRKENIPALCFISRLSPLPKDLFSLFYGAIGMPFWKYLLISLAGVSPVMFPTVIAGTSASNPLSTEFLVPFVICFFVMSVVFIAYKAMMLKKHR